MKAPTPRLFSGPRLFRWTCRSSGALDSGRYHSIWLPDHMVSFWPDSIWTPEFTDLATTSASPHRHLDGLAMAAVVAALTQNVPIATSVVDTVRRHPSLLAQSALTIDHVARGRFILGLGSGETENTLPYGGFDFSQARESLRGGPCRLFACCGKARARSIFPGNSIL